MAAIDKIQFRGFELTLPFPLLVLVLGMSGIILGYETSVPLALILGALVTGIALSGSV